MEWTGQEQVHLLLQSGGLGLALGVLYDLFGVFRLSRRRSRHSVFLADALFGAAAALVTFYTSLGIMDGRLHPLLFFGCAVGFGVQHFTVGRIGSRVLCTAVRALAAAAGRLGGWLLWPLKAAAAAAQRRIAAARHDKRAKTEAHPEKKRKNFPFFQKKA